MTTATLDKLTGTEEVSAACAARPDIAPYARLVGSWVWVEFPDKPSEDTRAFLKAIGFRWNKERSAWQHSCGHFTRRNRRIDPRQYYGQLPLGQDYCTRDEAGAPPPQYSAPRERFRDELNNFQAI